MKKIELFMPGQTITTEEEFAAGKNTFVENGDVKATNIGEAEFDNNTKEVSIKSKTLHVLKNGDIIIGRISLVKESVVVVDIIKAENDAVLLITRGQIPAKFVAQAYVTNVKEYYKVGDYIRAKVMSANELAVDLATNEQGLGITTAFCANCKKPMQFSNEKLMCFSCGASEKRKWFEQKDEQGERREFDRGERRFDSRGRNDHGGRSFGSRDRNDRPFRPREGNNRPFTPRGDNDKPFVPRGNEERNDRPFIPRTGASRPFEPRERSFTPRGDNDRSFRPRTDSRNDDYNKPRNFRGN
ncbi:MAG: exosome complex RNA-binding protein Csl4 [archaeon]|jgi:exosome complex component CSL4